MKTRLFMAYGLCVGLVGLALGACADAQGDAASVESGPAQSDSASVESEPAQGDDAAIFESAPGDVAGIVKPRCPTGDVVGQPCPLEGQACGAAACNADPCVFCNFLLCSGGVWRRIEVPPLPPDMCD